MKSDKRPHNGCADCATSQSCAAEHLFALTRQLLHFQMPRNGSTPTASAKKTPAPQVPLEGRQHIPRRV